MKRTRLSVIAAAAAILSTSLAAQAQQKGDWTVGARGGLSIPNLSTNSDNPLSTNYSSRMAGQAGVFGEYRFSKLFSIQVGLEYSGQGGKKDGYQAFPAAPVMNGVIAGATGPASQAIVQQLASQGIPSVALPTAAAVQTDLTNALNGFGNDLSYLYADAKSTAEFNYLMMPIYAKFGTNFSKTSPFRVYVGVGPFFSYMLSAHRITDFHGTTWGDVNGNTLPAAWTTSATALSMLQSMGQAAGSGDMVTAAKLAAEYTALSGINPQTQQPVFGIPSILGSIPTQDNDQNIYDEVNKFNFGIAANVGVSYSFGPTRRHTLFVEGGGNYGFIKIQKDDKNGNNNIGAGTVMLGYSFRVNR